MAKTRVANIRHLKGKAFELIRQGKAVYIGRRVRTSYGTFPASKWGNPFRLSPYATSIEREKCLRKYETYVRSRLDLMGALKELKGKVLLCWCYPLPCHGNVLIKLLKETER
ncbi:MAG: hypothetical protein DRI61_15110 [Chloroflexi bacterium]|nr:MAG: hypothetical protein DRI61_15110 [Chloroflexota bacterium]